MAFKAYSSILFILLSRRVVNWYFLFNRLFIYHIDFQRWTTYFAAIIFASLLHSVVLTIRNFM